MQLICGSYIQWFECVPYLSHIIYIIWSLVQAPKPELGVSDKKDIQNERDQDWSEQKEYSL